MAVFCFPSTSGIYLGLGELALEDACLSNNSRGIPHACLDETEHLTFKWLCLKGVNPILNWQPYIWETANTKLSPT